MIAYLDLPSGLSGDMFLGCLVDAGWPIDELRASLDALHLPAGSWSVRSEPVMRGPIRATLVHVETAETLQHRRFEDIRTLIERSNLEPWVQGHAIATFARLAMAEAKVHGQALEDVHFHEVGALDAIVDIVGAAAGIRALGVEQVYASAAPLGSGWTQSAHGALPLPAPHVWWCPSRSCTDSSPYSSVSRPTRRREPCSLAQSWPQPAQWSYPRRACRCLSG